MFDEKEETSEMVDTDFLDEIKQHATSEITEDDLHSRLEVTKESKTDLDEITAVEE